MPKTILARIFGAPLIESHNRAVHTPPSGHGNEFASIAVGRRILRTFIPLLAFVVLASTGMQAPEAAAAETILHAIGKPVCAVPRHPKEARCMAIRRVLVAEGTPEARRALTFRPAAGAKGDGTIGPAGGLTPSDLITAYGLPSTGGSGQTVALVDAYNDPNIEADLQVFDAQYKLSTCTKANGCLKVVGQTGSTTVLPANDTTGWSLEETLDVETVRSICPGCKILLVEANSESNADLGAAELIAVQLGATEISNSFGGPESQADANFEAAFNHPGVVITASTGDDGYYSFDQLGATDQANFPATSPYVIAVGGTSLYLGQNAARQSETVWNDNGVQAYFEQVIGQPLGASGGGCSGLFDAPGWQTHVAGWAKTGCGTKRLDADVAAVGDYLTGIDIYDSYDCGLECDDASGWLTIGGTSLASPLVAAVFALAGGAHGVPYPALTLYGHPGETFNVATGGNGWCDGEGASECGDPNLGGFGIVDCDYPATGNTPTAGDLACDAAAGYNGPTGVGTPKTLAAFTKTGPTAKIAGPTAIEPGVAGKWTATPTDPFPGGIPTLYKWNWGDGTTTISSTPSDMHTFKTGNVTRTISLAVEDNYKVTGAVTTYKVLVP